MSTPVIQIKQLVRTFSATDAVNGLDLIVKPGPIWLTIICSVILTGLA